MSAHVPLAPDAVASPLVVRLTLGLCVAAFLTYLAFDFLYLPASNTFPDEHRFIFGAMSIVESGEFSSYGRRAYDMPLVPMLYALLYTVTGSEEGLYAVARVLQALFLVAQSLLTGVIAARLFGSSTAFLLALAISLFYPFFVYYQGLLLSEPLFNLLLVAAMLLVVRWGDDGCRISRDLVAIAALLTLAIYAKGVLSILPPFLLAGYALVRARSVSRAMLVFMVVSALYCTFMSPWWLRNYEVLGAFVPFTTSSARVLYTGNNPAQRSGGTIEDPDWHSGEERERLPELEWSRAFHAAAMEHIREDPARFVRLSGLKFLRFWRLYPYAEGWNTGIYKWGSLLSFGVVLALSIVTAIWHWRRWRELTPFYLLFAYFTLVHMVYIGSIRYRLPLEPFLIVLASAPLARIVDLRLASDPPGAGRG